jgi:hypothetical protein
VAGKRADAEEIERFIGAYGKLEDENGRLIAPPAFFYVFEAAEVLKMPFDRLESHPDRARLMSHAFSYKYGKAKGEQALELNPEFWASVNKRTKDVEKAKEKKNRRDGFSVSPQELTARRAALKAAKKED